MRRIIRFGRAAATLLFTTTLVVAAPVTRSGASPTASAAAVPAISPAQLADPVFMEAFFRDHFLTPFPAAGFTGALSTCTPGTTDPAFRDEELERINAFRAIAGVPGVVEWPGGLPDAQLGALAWGAATSNWPPGPGDPCWTAGGAAAAAAGDRTRTLTGFDIYLGYSGAEQLMSGQITQAADDPDPDVILDPSVSGIAVGASTYAGSQSTGFELLLPDRAGGTPVVRDPSGLVAWPPCGAMLPYQLASDLWSVARPGLDTSAATIAVSRNGVPLDPPAFVRHRDVDSIGDSSSYRPLPQAQAAELLRPPSGNPDEYAIVISNALQDGVPTTVACDFALFDVNLPPNDIFVGPQSIAPDAAPGTTVGTLYSIDSQYLWHNGAGSTYAYALVAGPGDDDNGQFTIVGDQLLTSAAFVPTRGTRSLRIRSTEDRPGGVAEEVVTVKVQPPPVELPPLWPTELHITENQPAGAVVAAFPATDANGDPITYSLDSRFGGPSSPRYQFVGNQLVTTQPLDADTMWPEWLWLTATNGYDTEQGTVTVFVDDGAEEPRSFALAATNPAPGEVHVSWSAPPNAAPIERYEISWAGHTAVVDGSTLSFVISGLPAGMLEVKVTAVNSFGSWLQSTFTPVTSATNWPTVYSPLAPARLLDTRPAAAIGYGGAKPDAGAVVEVQVTGLAGVPADARAVALNVTITDATASGYVTAYPAGTPTPNASNLNVEAGGTVANSVIVKIGAGGKVALYTERGGHLIVDVAGYWTFGDRDGVSAGRLLTVDPSRVLDSRIGLNAGAALPADGSIQLRVTGTGGVPAAGVAAVTLNLTATDAAAPGYLTVWPGGTARPNASNLNVTATGQTVANQVIVPVGADGTIEIYSESGTHVIADITGYVTDSSATTSKSGMFVPLDPFRRIDTRSSPKPVAAGGIVRLFENVPYVNGKWTGEIIGYALNVTATQTTGAGYVSVYPCDEADPDTSTLNMTAAGQTVPNAAIASTARSTNLCMRTSAATHLIADVFGYFIRI